MDAAGFDRDSLIARSDLISSGASSAVHASSEAAALVDVIDALRMAVIATIAPAEAEVSLDDAPWARVELFGHAVRVGIVREVERYGHRWIEVTQPALWRDPDCDGDPDLPVVVKLYHPNAVYAIDEYDDEEEARQANRQNRGIRWPNDPREF